jgi:hypothetical protein
LKKQPKGEIKMKDDKKLDGYFWGGVLLLAGLIFGAEAIGFLPQIGNASSWSWVFLGAGLLSIVLNFISLSSSTFEDPTTWDWVWGVIFLLIGVGGFTTVDISWPIILILIGLGMLIKAFFRKE